MAFRKFGVAGLPGRKSKRLSVVETLMPGPKYRLVMVRCDSKEHVVVLGPQGATLVDSAAAAENFPAILAATQGRAA